MDINIGLQQKVSEEILWDPGVDATHVDVAARGGVITLTGYVSCYAEKKNAEQAAKRVANVKAVVNEIEVRLLPTLQRSDADIAESALTGLRLNANISGELVKLSVENGWIALDGEVDWRYQRTAAEGALKHMIGVKGIVNRITIKSGALAADIKSRIRSALLRNAQLDANRIVVNVSGGRAILDGEVMSWAEREQAEEAAWRAPEITEVVNNIHVDV